MVFRGFAGACARCGAQWSRGAAGPLRRIPAGVAGRLVISMRSVGPGLLIGWAWGGCARCGSAAPCGSWESRWVVSGTRWLQSDVYRVTLFGAAQPMSRDNAGGCNCIDTISSQSTVQRSPLSTAWSSGRISSTANPIKVIQEPMWS